MVPHLGGPDERLNLRGHPSLTYSGEVSVLAWRLAVRKNLHRAWRIDPHVVQQCKCACLRDSEVGGPTSPRCRIIRKEVLKPWHDHRRAMSQTVNWHAY